MAVAVAVELLVDEAADSCALPTSSMANGFQPVPSLAERHDGREEGGEGGEVGIMVVVGAPVCL